MVCELYLKAVKKAITVVAAVFQLSYKSIGD